MGQFSVWKNWTERPRNQHRRPILRCAGGLALLRDWKMMESRLNIDRGRVELDVKPFEVITLRLMNAVSMRPQQQS